MINYPNGKKNKALSSPSCPKTKSTSRRGMTLENEINLTNEYYLQINRANIHKKPTPITIVNVDYPSRNKAKITEAYFKVASTTDYNGVYKGKAIDFEAKESHDLHRFPFTSIHDHQIQHLKNVVYHGAIAFVIIRFTRYDETYLVDANQIIELYYGKRKSIPYQWFKENAPLIPYGLTPPINYLNVVDQLYLRGKENDK
ncbi:MAG: Holliday junction resolvase RecU [Erysipelotrichaceae bacterium]